MWTALLAAVVAVGVLTVGLLTKPGRTGMYGDFEDAHAVPAWACPVLISREVPMRTSFVRSSSPGFVEVRLRGADAEAPEVEVLCSDDAIIKDDDGGWSGRERSTDGEEYICLTGSHGQSCVETLGRSDEEIRAKVRLATRAEWDSLVERGLRGVEAEGRYPWLPGGQLINYYEATYWTMKVDSQDADCTQQSGEVLYTEPAEGSVLREMEFRLVPGSSVVGGRFTCFGQIDTPDITDHAELITGEELRTEFTEQLALIEQFAWRPVEPSNDDGAGDGG